MGSAASLVFYISLFLASVLFVFLGNRKRAPRLRFVLRKRRLVLNPFLLIGAIIPILIAGFRQGVGTDFSSYVIEYNAAIQSGSYLEISFNIISYISNTFFGSPTFMFIVFSAMTVLPVMLAINKSSILRREYRWLFWMLFLFIMFPQTFNLLRQGVAVAIGFHLIISIMENGRLFKLSHILNLILAVSFHTSAWVLVPIALIARAFNNTRAKSIIFFVIASGLVWLACLTIIPQLLQMIGGNWSSYLENTLVSRSVVPRSLLILFILMICWKFYRVLKISNSYIAFLWIGLLSSIAGLFVAYFERAGYYVTLLVPLLIMVVIAQKVSRGQVSLVKSLIFMFALAYFIIVYYLMSSSDIFPYNWSI